MNTSATRGVWPLAATQIPNARLTWDQWCAMQKRRVARQHCHGEVPFSDRELAHLTFLRWLYADRPDHEVAGPDAA